jgi:DNA-binding transcriptional ArsR family regulator
MVVDISAEHTDRVFHALADATRREIVALTLGTDHSVSDLARRFPMSFAAVQKHVAVLESAGLVVKQRQGREVRVRADPDALEHAHRLLDAIADTWRSRIGRIDDLLADDAQKPNSDKESTDARDRRPQGR